MTERKGLMNQERIRTLEEKETKKYLGICEATTMKQAIKEKNNKKSTSEERENF